MKNLLFLFSVVLCLAQPALVSAQTRKATSKSATATQSAKKIKELQDKREGLRQNITEKEKLLVSTKNDVKSQLSGLALISGQIDEHKTYIKSIEGDVYVLNAEVGNLQGQIDTLEAQLNERRRRYEQSVKYMYKNRTIQDKLMFIFSAKSVSQLYRRMRYVREYAVYQRAQGEIIANKERQILEKRSELLNVKGEKDNLLRQGVHEQKVLEGKQQKQQAIVTQLQKKQSGLQKELASQKKRAQALDSQIDRLVAKAITSNSSHSAKVAEIKKKTTKQKTAAKAKVAETEKKLVAAKKAVETAKAKKAAASKKSASEKDAAAKEYKSAVAAQKQAEVEEQKAEAEEQQVNNDAQKLIEEAASSEYAEVNVKFEHRKGSLPMPISGTYVIVSHFGQNKINGLKDVVLPSNGIGLKGSAGANARCIYEGEVSQVFTYGGTINVLVRHGSYISVYSNLSSVSVSRGQKVRARDVIGRVSSDSDGNALLSFQLRKEVSKLNPEQWLAK